jgi:hypothetical protein
VDGRKQACTLIEKLRLPDSCWDMEIGWLLQEHPSWACFEDIATSVKQRRERSCRFMASLSNRDEFGQFVFVSWMIVFLTGQ